MNDPNTTITIRTSSKKGFGACKNHPRETWDDLVVRVTEMCNKIKNEDENNEE